MTIGGVIVEQDVWIDAAPHEVYRYLVDPQRVVRWMGRSVDLDPRPGGSFRCEMNDDDVFRGEIVELVQDARMVFTFGWEAADALLPPGTSTVEVTLTAEAGGTRVRLTHRGLPQPAADLHAQGWRLYLDRLAVAAAGGNPGPDPNATSGNM